MQTPFNLAAGLNLERSGTLLPWDSTLEDLARLGTPEVYRHQSTTNICWKNEEVLGGLSAHVEVMGAAGPNAFYVRRTKMADSPQAEYDDLLIELKRRLGSAHSTVTDDGYPWSRWTWGNVTISVRIAERFTEYVALMVAKGLISV
jgi:hypothetical protein